MIPHSLLPLIVAGQGAAAQPEAIDFDGANDYLSRASDLVGNADGKTFTFSAWVYIGFTSGSSYIYKNFTTSPSIDGFWPSVSVGSSGGTFQVLAYNSGTENLNVQAQFLPLNTWLHIVISADMSNVSNRSVYVNNELNSASWPIYNNVSLPFSKSAHEIGGTELWRGRLAHVYLDYTYRDLSIEANRRLFITDDLRPADGLAGLSPILYLPLTDPTAPGTNKGTGGDFTLNGTVARSGRGPNQTNVPASDLDGTADYGSKASGLTGAVDAKTVTFSVNVKLDTVSGTQVLYDMDAGDFRVSIVSGVLTFTGKNAAGTSILSITAGDLVAFRWYNISASFDLANTANRAVMVDGVPRSLTVTTYTNDNLDLTTSAESFGADTAGGSKLNGQVGGLWFDDSYTALG